ncbi:MAG: cardiolipin synthase [Verrucomicrobiota bacterium]
MVERLIEHPATWLEVLHLAITLGIAVRVIMRRPGPGVALAWVAIVGILPYVGALLYLLFGEVRISKRRARRIAERKGHYEELVEWGIAEGLASVDWSKHPPEAAGMDRLGRKAVGFPTVTGSRDELFSDTGEVLDAIARDVDAAEKSVLMEFYIWNEGGKADEVLEALIRAAERGVKCRVLVDAVGGRPWWKGKQPKRLRRAGVQVRAALPVGLYRLLFARTDLRMHRKIVVIDGKVAWTGSMNMVDPRFFKQEANVGEWVDAMARMEGTVVGPLSLVMLGDWMNECGETIHDALRDLGHENVRPNGTGDVQVVPSGVGETSDGLLQMLLATIHSAKEELILTTPYFVPDESMLRALRGAAGRGVKVDLIVPEKVDSLLTRYASRSYYDELMETGVRIQLYRGGLLHTKSITADRCISMFGTVNLDMRSLWINYEVALFVYGREFGEHLHELQASYLEDSVVLDPDEWEKRSRRERLMENTFRLVSPIL